MSNNEPMVSITQKRHASLLRSESHLSALKERGVDNWDGYVGVPDDEDEDDE